MKCRERKLLNFHQSQVTNHHSRGLPAGRRVLIEMKRVETPLTLVESGVIVSLIEKKREIFSHSKPIITISGDVPIRSGGPQVPTPQEVYTSKLPKRSKPYTNWP